MDSKDLLALCQKANMDVKNQLSSLDPEQRDLLVELVKRGGATPPPPPPRPSVPLPKPVGAVPVLEKKPAPIPARPARVDEPSPVAEQSPATEPPALAPAASMEPVHAPRPAELPSIASELLSIPRTELTAPIPSDVPTEAPRPVEPEVAKPVAPAATAPSVPPPADTGGSRGGAPKPPSGAPGPDATRPPAGAPRMERPVRDLGGGARRSESGAGGPGGRGPDRPRRPLIGSRGAQHVAPLPPQRKPSTEDKKPPPPAPTGPRKIAEIPPEMHGKPIRIEDILNPKVTPATIVPEGELDESDEDARKRGPRSVAGRDKRHADRQARAKERVRTTDGDKGVLVEEPEKPERRLHRIRKKQHHGLPTQPRKGKVPIELPISVRSLSEAVGIKSADLIKKLFGQGIMVTINSGLEPEIAEMVALEHGVELDVKKKLDAEDLLLAKLTQPDEEATLQPRAPIVTIMGHVDHGKTSLLDRIRKSNIVDTEAGGITQCIRAWRVEHNGKPITFLDTPGHEAFTKMRARGANVTDIAVIVVAAPEGVQPQTEEAISHAKAAEVAMVVAINKVDLPNANLPRTRQQLYSLGILPDDMGGDVPFVETSAVTGKGIDDLLEAIQLVSDFQLVLKANPDKPGKGTCLEASISENEGVVATLLVREGTLRRGDVIICGASSGRVRALYNDLGKPLDAAGPGVPCRITGLDEVPNADDEFVVVPDLATAGEIADKRKQKLHDAAVAPRGPLRLEDLALAKVAELKIVLKADVRGSVEAIRKELEKLQHDEVKLRVLHAGIGAINESDVMLALISPADTLLVGFNVVPDDAAKALADERSLQIREYKIIYELTNDIRSALEGKLKPREEVVHLGRAVVRQTFKIGRVGTIAGCYVTQGSIERSGKVRLIRNGVVIYPPAEKTAGLESLKRFKEDAREVQQGYECGVKMAGYDDIKVDDVIECYRVDQVQRTLS